MTGYEIVKQKQIKGLNSRFNILETFMDNYLYGGMDNFKGNFTLTYTGSQITRKTYANNNYVTISYNSNGSVNQKKYYLSDNTLILTQTAQYSDGLFLGWV